MSGLFTLDRDGQVRARPDDDRCVAAEVIRLGDARREVDRSTWEVLAVTLHRMDHVGVIVGDLDAAVAFFEELGLERIGGRSFGGDERVDRINGLQDVRSEMAMLDVPGGKGRLELIEHVSPPVRDPDPDAPPNTAGLRHLCFAVDDLHDTLERLRPHGAALLGEVVDYDDAYRLAYVRGPAGIILELAEAL